MSEREPLASADAEGGASAALPGASLPDASPELVAAIDEAAAASLAAPGDLEAQERLWRATFSLERWLFLARGADEEPAPFALRTDEGAVVFAFSTAERARVAALGFGLSEEEAGRLLAVPLPAAAAWVASYAEAGVEALVFDTPVNGAMAPLTNLAAMAVWISQNPDA